MRRRTFRRRWAGAAIATAALAGLVLVPAVPASAAVGGNVGFRWEIPNAPSDGLSDLTFPMTFFPETQRAAGIYVAQQFAFYGLGGGGYTGLQPRPDKDGRGQMRGIFSSFIAGTTSDDPQCTNGADGGAGVSCSGLVDVVYGHTYNLNIENRGERTWAGTAVDATTGARTHLGSYTLPSGAGKLKPSFTGFLETYSSVPDCAHVPKTKVLVGLPTTRSGRVGTLENPHEYEACVGEAGYSAQFDGDSRLLLERGSVSARRMPA